MWNGKPKMLVIGSRGFLGRHVMRVAAPELTLIEGNRTTNGQLNEVRIDLEDKDSVVTAFDQVRPDVVLLLAAHSDIDYCERYPEDARAVNLRGAEHVAVACARTNARLLFASSGAVFDGRQHGYTEDSLVSPVSVYGETKAEAEKLILALLPDAIVVRLALVIGFAAPPGANAFLDNLRKRWASGESVALPVFEQRNPIDAVSCSQFIFELVNRQKRGIFHIGCTDSISRYHLGLKLASRMGYADCVHPQLEPTPGRALRGPNHFLLTGKLRAACAIPIPTCDQVIERCFDGIA
ncbi:MAG TPA: sugar nucleotide-binding protein [Silvibacterium sp.]|jgi:dTDP-4-dehydrorhamnose reductase|nr:sugar nucleotide-binding protein [Silvibacterium sp.]